MGGFDVIMTIFSDFKRWIAVYVLPEIYSLDTEASKPLVRNAWHDIPAHITWE